MRGHARCLAGALWPYLGTLLGREPSALCRGSHLACKSEPREGSKRGGLMQPREKFQVKHDKRFQIRKRLAERRQQCLVRPVLLGQGVDLAPENEI